MGVEVQNTPLFFRWYNYITAAVVLSETCTNSVALPDVLKLGMIQYSDGWKAQNEGRSPAEFFLGNLGGLDENLNIWPPYWWLPD